MAQDISISHKSLLALAVPFIVSTLTQPLLGAVDTAVIGRLDNASYIGGVAIGATIFNTIYWLFGFLRVSTSGFSAQSLGSQASDDKYFAYFRPLVISIGISLMFLVLQNPIKQAALLIYDPAPDVAPHIITYFDIVIWGAPLVLTGYVNLGWFMGRKLVRETLFLQISTNVLNIVLDLIFVLAFEMGVMGVAWATLLAQFFGFVLGFYIISTKLKLLSIAKYKAGLLQKSAIKKIMGMNSDLVIRTLCLLGMINMFMAKSSELGVELLAVNAVLFHIQFFIAYLFDGLGNAVSVFSGKSVQEKDLTEFRRIFRISTQHTLVLSLTLSLAVLMWQDYIIMFFTDLENIILLCKKYMIWLEIFPLVIGLGLVYFGVYVGATYVSPVRDSMLAALSIFAAVYFGVVPVWGNHGLWLAFILFSLTRSVYLILYRQRLERKLFQNQPG